MPSTIKYNYGQQNTVYEFGFLFQKFHKKKISLKRNLFAPTINSREGLLTTFPCIEMPL